MPNLPANKVSLYPLAHYGLLSILSADNLKFLQGQFTCDLREIGLDDAGRGPWRYGALCTNKGRMVGNFLLAQRGPQHHLMRLHGSILPALQDTLKKFAPFYKGTLSDITTNYRLLGIAGKGSASLLESTFSVAAPAPGNLTVQEDYILIALDHPRYECWLKADRVDVYWQNLTASASVATEQDWDLLSIRAGLGEVRQATLEAWTPHMLNLPTIGAVSFKKGCYTGQEIVARTEYRGQQKRAMYRLQGEGEAPPPGTDILEGEQSAGEIVMASASSAAQWEGLAVLADAHLGKSLHCMNNPVLQLSLPYTVERKSAELKKPVP